MLLKLLCWLLGHKTMYKVATGEVIVADGYFNHNVRHLVMKWARSKHCLRCGKEIHPET